MLPDSSLPAGPYSAQSKKPEIRQAPSQLNIDNIRHSVWSDWKDSFPFALGVFRDAKLLTGICLLSGAVSCCVGSIGAKPTTGAAIELVFDLISSICSMGLTINCVRKRWAEVQGLQPARLSFNLFRTIWIGLGGYAYGTLVGFGSLFYIFPGFILAIRLSLMTPIMVIEARTIKGALAGSFSITAACFWLLVRYLCLPTVTAFACVLVPLSLAYGAMERDPRSLQSFFAVLQFEPVQGFVNFFFSVLSLMFSMSIAYMQTNAYAYCKATQRIPRPVKRS